MLLGSDSVKQKKVNKEKERRSNFRIYIFLTFDPAFEV
jgi:hypothetical protein